MTNSKEAQRKSQRKWYIRNRESILEKRAKHYQENRERLRRYGREYDRKRRSSKNKDTTKQTSSKQSDNSSQKAAVELRNRLLREIDEY